MSHESDQDVLLQTWRNALRRATDFDVWGQPVEAIDVYHRLSKQLHAYSNSNDTDFFTEHQKKILEKIALCLDSRRKVLQANASNSVDGVSLEDLRQLQKILENLPRLCSSESSQMFPVDMSVASAQLLPLNLGRSPSPEEDGSITKGAGTLLPKPLPMHGKTVLTITIEHINLKDASQYLDPFISVSVKDSNGKALTASQDTPVSARKEDSAIVFNTNVHIQKTLESLPPGFAIFFEFKHFKPKKAMVSTRCWAFMEQDEIKDGSVALEIYKKPTDYRRKCLKLLTVKPLYLHVRLSLFS